MSTGTGWQVAGAIAMGIASGAIIFPAALPLYTRRYHQKYDKNNDPHPVDDYSLGLVSDVLTEIKMPAEKEGNLDVFMSRDIHPQYHGSFALRWPCLLGLPFSFKWRSEEEFNAEKENAMTKNFPWSHPLTNEVKAALILTDSEKRFVIARQLGYLDTQNVLATVSQRMCCMLLAFVPAHVINTRLGLFRSSLKGRAVSSNKPTIIAGCVYAVMSMLGYAVFVMISDSYRCYLDRHADRYAGLISPEYSLAGYSYYNKVLKCNVALRQLLPDGEKRFTLYGNEVLGPIRTRHMPLASRRDQIKAMYKRQIDGAKEPQNA